MLVIPEVEVIDGTIVKGRLALIEVRDGHTTKYYGQKIVQRIIEYLGETHAVVPVEYIDLTEEDGLRMYISSIWNRELDKIRRDINRYYGIVKRNIPLELIEIRTMRMYRSNIEIIEIEIVERFLWMMCIKINSIIMGQWNI